MSNALKAAKTSFSFSVLIELSAGSLPALKLNSDISHLFLTIVMLDLLTLIL